MPTLKPNIPFDPANMASKLPEPLQRVGGFVGGLLGHLTGADDPTSAVPGPQELAGPLVSLYKNPEMRKHYTELFREAAKRMYPPHYHASIDAFIDRYPRVAAHADLRAGSNLPNRAEGNTRMMPVNNFTGAEGREASMQGARYPVTVDRYATGHKTSGTPHTVFHELQHVGQGLGNSRGNELYGLMSGGLEKHPAVQEAARRSGKTKEFTAYQTNPFERNAEMGAFRHNARMEGREGPIHVPIYEQIAGAAKSAPQIPELQYADAIAKQRQGLAAPSFFDRVMEPFSRFFGIED